jgi:hypothetical protein
MKGIEYSEYEFNKSDVLMAEKNHTPDGWMSRNSFDLKECEKQLREDINNILKKYGKNNI